MATYSDILSVGQNIVQAISYLTSTYLSVQGSVTRSDLDAAICLATRAGRIARVSVTTAGAPGAIYDANDAALTSNKLYVIPATLGVFEVNLPYSFGLVIAPGAGQVVSVSYS